MRFRLGLACALAVLIGGCGGSESPNSVSEPSTTSTVAPEEAAQKRQEEEDNAKAKREEERMIREHEPGAFGG
ncbi:MAG: hypothetical protein JWL67_239 [Solirubrobacterales bacterium]|nr:hypothetical protein [Solirubrobacterales bacterium]